MKKWLIATALALASTCTPALAQTLTIVGVPATTVVGDTVHPTAIYTSTAGVKTYCKSCWFATTVTTVAVRTSSIMKDYGTYSTAPGATIPVVALSPGVTAIYGVAYGTTVSGSVQLTVVPKTVTPPPDTLPNPPPVVSGTHEPAGMLVQINTGPISSVASVGFTIYSPNTMDGSGNCSCNLVKVPDGTGVRILYPTALPGGDAPIVATLPIKSPGATTYYQRWRVRTVKNWNGPRNGNGVKMAEPQPELHGPGSGAGTNDILMMWPNGGSGMSAMEGLQGPNNHFANMGLNQGKPGNLADGAWHTDERIFIAETTPGSGNGQYYAYYDGVLVAAYTNVLWSAPGNPWGITEWLLEPTFGGAPSSTHPLQGDFWDFDSLYISTK